METRRLRTLVDPREAQLLLDSYVASAEKLPAFAYKQAVPARLPQAFQDRIERAESDGSVWCAWTHGQEAWLFVGQLNLNRARERGRPVLELEIYDFERQTKSRVITVRGANGCWQTLSD